MRFEEGRDNTLYFHMTLLPYLGTSEEYKTKPTQHSVATLRGMGIQPDGIILRSKTPVPEDSRNKIALFTNVEARDVFSSADADYVYAVPEMLEQQGIGRFIERQLGLDKVLPDLRVWQEAVRILRNPGLSVNVGIVGKYVGMPDAYLSLLEALRHAGIANDAHVNVTWVNSEELDEHNVSSLGRFDAILVPGGFGVRGIEGKVLAARFARSNAVPYLGICLGMQIAVIDFARDVAGLDGANSTEFDPYTPHPVVSLMPEQLEAEGTGGTMRLGSWPMQITPGTLLARLYGVTSSENALVAERHRHRYEINPQYTERLTEAGLLVSGRTPGQDGRGQGLVEAVELKDHPFFLGLQSHPEFNSRLMRPSPPFSGLIHAAAARHQAAQATDGTGRGAQPDREQE
jgi:CTP synthase